MAEERPTIVFDLPAAEQEASLLEEEREKHRRRALKFGSDYVDPAKARRGDRDLMLEARKERLARPGFATGIDVFSQEEIDKRVSRAARFGAVEGLQGITYAPDEDELAKARRAKKFGVEYAAADGAMMDMDLFEERAEVPRDAERRPDGIYLYGVDVMSTGDCLAYFKEYGPTFVEWINDSACVVVFRDRFSAARAIAGMGRPLPVEEMTGESSAGLDPTDPANMQYFWHKGQDFIKQGTPIHLIYRMACVSDKKDVNAPRKTRELWRTSRGGQGSNKSRRQRSDQTAGHARVDADGDVDMGAADGAEGEGRRRRGRRRKGRQADGSTVAAMDTDDDVPAGPGLDWQQGEGAEGEGGQQGVNPSHEMDPFEGRMGAEAAQDGAAPAQGSILRRMIKAKREMAKGTQQPGVGPPSEAEQLPASINGTPAPVELVPAADQPAGQQ